MNLHIRTIPLEQHRYATHGDYWTDPDGVQHIVVTDLPDPRYSFLIALHELIEAKLCELRGIAEPDIMAFDIAVPATSPFHDDPGHDPAAPYNKEHVFAECIERLVAAEMGVNWQDYEAAL